MLQPTRQHSAPRMKFLLVGPPTVRRNMHTNHCFQVLLEILIRRADRGRECRYAETQK